MSSTIRIKRSQVSGNPNTLAAGELAYSALVDNGSNGGDRLYIGIGTETAGNAANHVVIGGKFFTDAITAATSDNTASTLVRRDASGNFSANIITAALNGNATTATTLQTSRNFSASGDATAPAVAFNGSGNVNLALTLANSGVVAGVYGGGTSIPVITIDAKGRITSANTASISTTLNFQGDGAGGGTGSIELANNVLTFKNGTGISSVASGEDITITNTGVVQISGTANQVSASSGTGSVTLSLPQNIHTGATPQFAGATLTGALAMSANRITGLADPVNAQDAATKQYVDAVKQGLDPKDSVIAATVTNITLSGTQIVDDVSLVAGNRVLVKNQTTASQNGIYVVSASAWTRAVDFNTSEKVTSGAFTFVEEGTANADSGFVLTTDGLVTLGTTPLTFVQFSGAGQITAGIGLSKIGNTLNVNVAIDGGIEIVSNDLQLKSTLGGNGLSYSAGVLTVGGTANRITTTATTVDIASTYVGQTSITTLGTIATGTWQGSIISPTYGGTGVNNGNRTLTLGGNFTHTGAHTLGLTTTANTSVTLPTTGTLSTLAGAETLTNKTITGAIITTGSINNTPIGATTSSTGAFTTLTSNGATTFTSTTNSTNATTGALVVTGGVGIGGTVNIGGDLVSEGSSIIGFDIDGGIY